MPFTFRNHTYGLGGKMGSTTLDFGKIGPRATGGVPVAIRLPGGCGLAHPL
jgi:hypothetical protein